MRKVFKSFLRTVSIFRTMFIFRAASIFRIVPIFRAALETSSIFTTPHIAVSFQYIITNIYTNMKSEIGEEKKYIY